MEATVENNEVTEVSGNKCPKGVNYAENEIECPMRILTSSVLAEGLCVKMIPVRTDKPIPKNRLFDAMKIIKEIRIEKEVVMGEIVIEDFLGLGINLIATNSTRYHTLDKMH